MRKAGRTETLVDSFENVQNVQILNCHAVNHVPFVTGQPQKKGLRPIIKVVKSVKGVSCVDQLSFQLVTNVHAVAQNLPVGVRLHQFWEIWATVRTSLKVIKILKEGYTLPCTDQL